MATRSKIAPVNQTPDQIRANAAAEKARKAASKAALAASKAADAKAAAEAVKPTPPAEPHDAHVAAAKAEADRLAFVAALRVDAKAILGEDASEEAIEAYVAEQLAPAAEPEKQRYNGPMLALVSARKTYVKAANGILCNGDRLATVCGAHTREETVAALIKALKLPGNPYAKLNPGQQSMNLRNKARHALQNGTLTMAEIEAAFAK